MARRRIQGLQLFLDDRNVAVESLAIGIAGDILVLSTTVPSLGLTVHSTYHGHAGLDTQIVHLALMPGRPRQDLASCPHEDLPVSYARERCLLDHLAYVREKLEEHTAASVALDVEDIAIAAVS